MTSVTGNLWSLLTPVTSRQHSSLILRKSLKVENGYGILQNKKKKKKNVNRKVESMPQSQTAAHPRHQEEGEKDKNIQAQNKQTNVRKA